MNAFLPSKHIGMHSNVDLAPLVAADPRENRNEVLCKKQKIQTKLEEQFYKTHTPFPNMTTNTYFLKLSKQLARETFSRHEKSIKEQNLLETGSTNPRIHPNEVS